MFILCLALTMAAALVLTPSMSSPSWQFTDYLLWNPVGPSHLNCQVNSEADHRRRKTPQMQGVNPNHTSHLWNWAANFNFLFFLPSTASRALRHKKGFPELLPKESSGDSWNLISELWNCGSCSAHQIVGIVDKRAKMPKTKVHKGSANFQEGSKWIRTDETRTWWSYVMLTWEGISTNPDTLEKVGENVK